MGRARAGFTCPRSASTSFLSSVHSGLSSPPAVATS